MSQAIMFTDQSTCQGLAIITFQLQLNNGVKPNKVYIRYENPQEGSASYEIMEMKQNQNNLYTIDLQLNHQLYYYQYIIEKNGQRNCEQNFRHFQLPKQSQLQTQNKIDQWNKVWCRYRLNQKKQSLFLSNFKIQLFRSNDTPLIFEKSKSILFTLECSELVENNNQMKQRSIKIINNQTNNEFVSQEIQIESWQNIFMNQIDLDFSMSLFSQETELKIREELEQEKEIKLKTLIAKNQALQQVFVIKKIQCEYLQKNYEEEVNKYKVLEQKFSQEQSQENIEVQELQSQIQETLKQKIELEIQYENERQNMIKERDLRLNAMKQEFENQKLYFQQQISEMQNKFEQEINEFQQYINDQLSSYKKRIEEVQLEQQLHLQKILENQSESLQKEQKFIKQIDLINLPGHISDMIQKYQNSIDQLMNQQQELKFFLQKSQNKIKVAQTKWDQLDQNLRNSQQLLSELTKKLQNLEEENLVANQKEQKYASQIIALKKQLSTSQKGLEECKQCFQQVKQDLVLINEQNLNIQKELEEKQQLHEKLMKENYERIQNEKKQHEQTIQRKMQELEQQQEIEIKEQKQKFQQFDQEQNLLFQQFSEFLQKNLFGGIYDLSIMYAQNIFDCYSQEIQQFIIEELKELKKQLNFCCGLISSLFCKHFDVVKQKSAETSQDIITLMESMKTNPSNEQCQQLFQQIVKFKELGQKISEILENASLKKQEFSKINKINQYLRDLGQGQEKIKRVISTKINTLEELKNFQTKVVESKNKLEASFSQYLSKVVMKDKCDQLI